MKKLTMDVDALEVESFDAELLIEKAEGSVEGFQYSGWWDAGECRTLDPNNSFCTVTFAPDPESPCTPVCHPGTTSYTEPANCP